MAVRHWQPSTVGTSADLWRLMKQQPFKNLDPLGPNEARRKQLITNPNGQRVLPLQDSAEPPRLPCYEGGTIPAKLLVGSQRLFHVIDRSQ